MALLRPSDLQKEMFIFGSSYCTELRTLRREQTVYERRCRDEWNRILSREYLDETDRYDTDQVICNEVDFHMENGDLEFAFCRASGPNVRCKF